MTVIPSLTLKEVQKADIPHHKYHLDSFLGGSRQIVDPPPQDTDVDYCILTEDMECAAETYRLSGFREPHLSDAYKGEYDNFITFRKGDVNLLVFTSEQEFGAVRAMTALAKKLNVTDKKKRYAMFETARATWRKGYA